MMVNDARASRCDPGVPFSPENGEAFIISEAGPGVGVQMQSAKLNPYRMQIGTTVWTERAPPPRNVHILLSGFLDS